MNTKTICLTCVVSALLALANVARAQGTAFTYQGRLTANDVAANGSNDLTFTLYDAASGGATVGVSNVVSDLAVTNGLFTVVLDFGAAFDGNARWLQVAVRPGASAGAYTNLVPRQSITATPYAMRALSAGSAGSAATATTVAAGAVNNLALASDAVDGAKILNGSITSADLNASLLNGTFWNLGGNAGTTPGTQFLGTTDNQPLEFKVNGARVLRVEPNATSPNLLGGFSGNVISNGIRGAVIAGGGHTLRPNIVGGNYAAVLGGEGNTASGASATAMGFASTASANYSVALGASATAGGDGAIALGYVVTASGPYSVGLGGQNTADGYGSLAAGGQNNLASNTYSVALGGFGNVAAGWASFAHGTQAKSVHDGSWVWADYRNADFFSTGTNQFLIRASGGVGINTNNPNGAALAVNGSVEVNGTITGSGAGLTGLNATALTGTISSNNIAAGTITTTMLAAGAVGSNQLAAGAVTTTALAAGAVTAAKVATVSNWFPLTIANPTPALQDIFGYSVAAVGNDRVLIGAFGDNTGAANNAGAAYLFSTNGALLTTFTNPTPAFSDSFGWSVAAVGTDRVLIGAPVDNTGAQGAGAAYLFSTNGTLLTTFTNPTPAFGDNFGWSVAAVGNDHVLIGTPYDDTGAVNAGAAYLFRTNGVLLTTFTKPTPVAGDNFGISVAAVGNDRVLIGAQNDDTGALNAGAAYLFRTNGTLLTTFTNPTPAADDLFGSSVAAVGADRVLIGAPADDSGPENTGAAYLFSTNGTFLTAFINPNQSEFANFGSSVAAVGTDRLLIGAPYADTGALNAGAAYLFRTNGTLISTFTNPTPVAGDQFGISVAAVGTDRVLVGAQYDDTGAQDAGAAYLFSLENFTPGLVAEAVHPTGVTTASLADGAVTTSKLADGAVTASKIGGVLAPSQIPDLDASKVTTGTLADARLSANVALRGGGNTFTGNQIINGRTEIQSSGGFSEPQLLLTQSQVNEWSRLRFRSGGPEWDIALSAGASPVMNFFNGSGNILQLRQDGDVWMHRNLIFDTGSGVRQMLDLWNGEHAIGVQSWTTYFRTIGGATPGAFAWYRGGAHADGQYDPGGGEELMRLNAGGLTVRGTFVSTSDRNAKENFTPVSPREVLEKVAALPISRWNFIGDAATPHVGPMAQDFYAAFGTGTDERHIATVDADGVALAAIQGLNQKVDSENASLRAENVELKRELSEIKQLLLKLSDKKD